MARNRAPHIEAGNTDSLSGRVSVAGAVLLCRMNLYRMTAAVCCAKPVNRATTH